MRFLTILHPRATIAAPSSKNILVHTLFLSLGVAAFGQNTSNDGIFVYSPPTTAESIRQSKRAATFFPVLKLNPANERSVTRLSKNAYKISAWPQAGFNYDYYLFIPNEVRSRFFLATSIASGGAQGMGPDYYSEWAKRVVVEGNWETQIAIGLKAPLLYPAFDRPADSSPGSLTRSVMLLKKDRLSRLDLQFIAMIDDARHFISTEFGVELNEKVLLAGFSTSASFASRFTMMHPERVQAAAYGGISFIHILPYTQDVKKRTTLIYPVGVSDFIHITGIPFNREAYLKVPRFLTMGLLDTEDTTNYGGLYPSSMKNWIDTRLGTLETRWNNVTKILSELGNFEYKLYTNLGHSFIKGDYIEFLQRHNELQDQQSVKFEKKEKLEFEQREPSLGAYQVLAGSPEVFVIPKLHLASNGEIQTVDLLFVSSRGDTIYKPESLIQKIQIQIDVSPNSGYPTLAGKNPDRAYDSPLLTATDSSHVLMKSDIRFDIVKAVFIEYIDFRGHYFLLMYKPEHSDYRY